eukprot:767463-Hanusia_phi.AAC.3
MAGAGGALGHVGRAREAQKCIDRAGLAPLDIAEPHLVLPPGANGAFAKVVLVARGAEAVGDAGGAGPRGAVVRVCVVGAYGAALVGGHGLVVAQRAGGADEVHGAPRPAGRVLVPHVAEAGGGRYAVPGAVARAVHARGRAVGQRGGGVLVGPAGGTGRRVEVVGVVPRGAADAGLPGAVVPRVAQAVGDQGCAGRGLGVGRAGPAAIDAGRPGGVQVGEGRAGGACHGLPAALVVAHSTRLAGMVVVGAVPVLADALGLEVGADRGVGVRRASLGGGGVDVGAVEGLRAGRAHPPGREVVPLGAAALGERDGPGAGDLAQRALGDVAAPLAVVVGGALLAGVPWRGRVRVVPRVADARVDGAGAGRAVAPLGACVELARLAVVVGQTVQALGGEGARGVVPVEADTEEVAQGVGRGGRVLRALEHLVVVAEGPRRAADAHLALAVPPGAPEPGEALAHVGARQVGAVGVDAAVVEAAAALVDVEAGAVGRIHGEARVADAVVPSRCVDAGGVLWARVGGALILVDTQAGGVRGVAPNAGAGEAPPGIVAGGVLGARGGVPGALVFVGAGAQCDVVVKALEAGAEEGALRVLAGAGGEVAARRSQRALVHVLALPVGGGPALPAGALVGADGVGAVGVDRAGAGHGGALVDVLAVVRAGHPLEARVALAGADVDAPAGRGAAVHWAGGAVAVGLLWLVPAQVAGEAQVPGSVPGSGIPGVAQATQEAPGAVGGEGVGRAGEAEEGEVCPARWVVGGHRAGRAGRHGGGLLEVPRAARLAVGLPRPSRLEPWPADAGVLPRAALGAHAPLRAGLAERPRSGRRGGEEGIGGARQAVRGAGRLLVVAGRAGQAQPTAGPGVPRVALAGLDAARNRGAGGGRVGRAAQAGLVPCPVLVRGGRAGLAGRPHSRVAGHAVAVGRQRAPGVADGVLRAGLAGEVADPGLVLALRAG